MPVSVKRADGTGVSAGKAGGIGAAITGLVAAILVLLRGLGVNLPIGDDQILQIVELLLAVIGGFLGWSLYGVRRAQEK